MKISPLDIRKQDFTRRLRGYDPEEVQAFLHTLSAQWESVLDDVRRLEERLREMETKLRHYERVEEALQEALKTARESARQAIQAADHKAQQIRSDAEGDADRIKRDAEQDRIRMRQETQAILGRRKEIVARLRAFLMSEMEMLAHFEGEDPVGFIKLMPAEHQRRLAALVDVEEGTFEQTERPPQRQAAPPDEPPAAFSALDEETEAPSAGQPQEDEERAFPFDAPEEPLEQTPAEEEAPVEEDEFASFPLAETAAEADEPHETMAERLLRMDQEAALEEDLPTPPREIWTSAASEEEPGGEAAPPAEPDETPEQSESDEQTARPGWRQRSIIGTGTPRTDSETSSAAEEEIARIRRILSQLE